MTFLAAIAGLFFGSFLNVLLFRWLASPAGGPRWQGAALGRSRCVQCMHKLAWYDLVPVVSWLRLRGACRYCSARISVWYPIVELSMAGVLGVYAYRFGISSVWSVVDCAILFCLVALLFFDLKHFVLPDVLVAALGSFGILSAFGHQGASLYGSGAAGLALMAFFGLLHIISRGRWLGMGDVKLALAIGLVFGYPAAFYVTMYAIWFGALVGVGLILLRRATMKTAVPFGVFWATIAIGTMLIR